MGGSSSSQTTRTSVEAPNNLLSTAVLRTIDALCEGPIKGFVQQSGAYGTDPLVSTYYDNVPVRNLDGSYNFNVSGAGYQFYYTLGTSGQQAMAGFEKAESVVPLAGSSQVTSPPAGAGLPHSVVASFNSNMYPDADSVKVTFNIPALYAADNEGNIDQYTLAYAVDISLNDKPFQNYGVRTVVGKCTTPYLETSTYRLPKVEGGGFCRWTIRVRKTTIDVLSVKVQASLYVSSISVVTSSSFVYPNTVLVGNYLEASQFASVPARAYLIDGLLVSVPSGYTPTAYGTDGSITGATYPEIWAGNFQTGVWTDDPAWIFYDLVTNKRYGLGRYISPTSVDKWGLYQISQYCSELVDDGLNTGRTEPRFSCNVCISESEEAYNLLLNLSSVFRGMVYYANGTIHAVQTSDKTPVYNYTNANVIEGQFTYADAGKNTRATVALIHWRDPQNLYRESIEYIEDVAGIQRYGYIPKEIKAFACTSRGQAYRLGNWVLTSEKLLTETVSFRVGLEGLYIRPGDVFNVFDNFRSNRNQGGRVAAIDNARTTITLDRAVPLESGVSYVLSAVTPKETLAPADVTGSPSIDLIRNSQIETRQILTGPTSGTLSVTVDAAFSTSLYAGTPWIVSASGGGNLLNNASVYQCLNAAEVEPGVFEVVGLQYNTGINRLVDNGYNVVRYPPNSGDQSPISPPSGLTITPVTGTLANNNFFSYLQVGWTPSTGTNLAYTVVSGKPFGGNWFTVAKTTATVASYVPTASGLAEFRVAAVSNGGVYSDFITGGYTIQDVNPLGYVSGVSRLRLTLGADSTYLNASNNPTGYIDSSPGFAWDIPVDPNGNQEVSAQFISGYKFSVLDANTNAPLAAAAYLSGSSTTTYQLPAGTLGSNRLFKAQVETVDLWGNVSPASVLIVNNPAPLSSIGQGAAAVAGGFSYAVTPNPKDIDVSGLFLWYNELASFTPTFSNVNVARPGIAGTVNNSIEGPYYVWYSIIDTFGSGGSAVQGPLRVDPLSGVSGIQTQINVINNFTATGLSGAMQSIAEVRALAMQISGQSGVAGNLAITGQTLDTKINTASGDYVARFSNVSFALSQTGQSLAGQISSLSASFSSDINTVTSQITGEQYTRSQADQGLSTSISNISTSLTSLSGYTNAQISSVNVALASTGSSLASSISTLSSKTDSLSGYTNAQISNEHTAMTTASGALAASVSTLSTTVNGMSSNVTTLANAYIIGGQAVATWGFQLDANNKVVSMQAIAASGGSQATIGTIIFGGADLQSDNYSTGTAGWKLTHDGSFYGYNGTFRGRIEATEGYFAGQLNAVTINRASVFLADMDGGVEGGQLIIQMPTGTSGFWVADVYSNRNLRFFIEDNPSAAAVAEAEFQANLYAREYFISSSRALKQGIRPIGSTLEGLQKLNPVAYERRYLPEFGQYDDTTTELGFIAEEVQPIFPEVVNSGHNGHLSIGYSRFAPILTRGLQEEDEKVEALKRRVVVLESQIRELMKRLPAV